MFCLDSEVTKVILTSQVIYATLSAFTGPSALFLSSTSSADDSPWDQARKFLLISHHSHKTTGEQSSRRESAWENRVRAVSWKAEDITSNVTQWYHILYAGQQHDLWHSLAQNASLESNQEDTSNKPNLRDSLQNNWLLQNSSVSWKTRKVWGMFQVKGN